MSESLHTAITNRSTAIVLAAGAAVALGIAYFAFRPLPRNSRESVVASKEVQHANGVTQHDGEHSNDENTAAAVNADVPQGRLSWQQNLDEVVIAFKVAADIKSKDVHMKLNTGDVHVYVRDTCLLTGRLQHPIAPDDCSWQIDQDSRSKQKYLTLTLAKSSLERGGQAQLWTAILASDTPGDHYKAF